MSIGESIFAKNIQRGIASGILKLSDDESKIIYKCLRDYQVNFKNPEEKIRASYFAELVIDYLYPPSQIDIEVTVPRRTPEDRADIVVFDDKECKSPYLIVECKRDRITDAEFKQAVEQAFGNANSLRAKYTVVVAGNTRQAFELEGFKSNERIRNVLADIPIKYGKAPQYKFIKGQRNNELKEVSRDELISALEKCHDTVWQGGRLAPTAAFDEVSKLLFCKMKDEKDGTKRGEPYHFQIGTHEIPEEVFSRIDSIYQTAKAEDSEVFKEDIRLEPRVVFSVVQHLQKLWLHKIDLDTKGVAFETFMKEYFKGPMGQYFTPRPIIDFAVKMMEPKLDDIVLDPFCGSGGFLLAVLDTLRHISETQYGQTEGSDYWHRFAKNNLFGIEINEQIARVCKMNMIIHDDGHTNVISTDSLRFMKDITSIHKKFKSGFATLLLTNPPFGATVRSSEKEEEYLEQYKSGEDRQNQKTEILAVERCIEFLKPSTGRGAFILPDGILTNSSLQYIRDILLENCQILAIVSFPPEAFAHFGAGVKSSIVFVRRKSETEKFKDYPIFMAMAEHIGYDATGREDKNELPDILDQYNHFKEEPSFFV